MIGAFYDPITDKIYNCARNTLTWFHESRHRELTQKGINQQLDYLFTYTIVLSLAFLIIDHKTLASYALIFGLLSQLYLEVDAWIFGYINYKKYKKNL